MKLYGQSICVKLITAIASGKLKYNGERKSGRVKATIQFIQLSGRSMQRRFITMETIQAPRIRWYLHP